MVISSYTGPKPKAAKEPLPRPSTQTAVTITFATPQTQQTNDQKQTRATASTPPVVLHFRAQIERHQQRSSSADIRFSSPATPNDDYNDQLRLIHYFTLNTSATVADQNHSPAWRDLIPTLAFTHPFLLSGLLAVTSLHLAIVSPSVAQTRKILKHHTEALKLFGPQLLDINPGNASALFAFTLLIPIFALGARNTPMNNLDAVSGISEIFTLMRGVAIIVVKGGAWLDGVFFEAQFLPVPNFSEGTLLPLAIDKSILSLSTRNASLNEEHDPEGYEIYKATIATLIHSFLLANEFPRIKLVLLPLPIFGPPGLVERARKGEELALACFAHYAVLLFWLREDLWLRGWGRDIILEVEGRLGREWRDCVAWPFAEIERGGFGVAKE